MLKNLKNKKSQWLKNLYSKACKSLLALQKKVDKNPKSSKIILLFSIFILLMSSVVTGTYGALINEHNSDQLANVLIADNPETFREAELPGQHTFLLKWPLFFFAQLINVNSESLAVLTVFLVLTTTLSLAYILYRLDKRPLYFSVRVLALSSILLLTPSQPTESSLLPASLAMLTTRNIEYIVYIFVIYVFIKYKDRRDISLLNLIIFSLLVLTDKLFFVLFIGSSFLIFVYAFMKKQKKLSQMAVSLILLSLASLVLANLFSTLIKSSNITNITNSGNLSPYAISLSFEKIAKSIFFAINGTLTNFGANPSTEVYSISLIIKNYFKNLLNPIGLGFFINLSVLIYLCHVIFTKFKKILLRKKPVNNRELLALFVLSSFAVSTAAFLLTEHEYSLDSRYLAFSLFAVFVASTALTNKKIIKKSKLYGAITILSMTIFISFFTSAKIAKIQLDAYNPDASNNKKIIKIIKDNDIQNLEGDYWRILPIKFNNQDINIVPTENCIQKRKILSSNSWTRPNDKSFAFLVTNNVYGLSCSRDTAISKYGQPTAIFNLSNDKMQEELLLYEKIPIKKISCRGRTVLNIVAHPDDELLFMNPDTQESIDDNKCLVTVYLTSGDAGVDKSYWSNREGYIRKAYAQMTDSHLSWTNRHEKDWESFGLETDSSMIHLIFFRLPDGRVDGRGYGPNSGESMRRLLDEEIKIIKSKDRRRYTQDKIVQDLVYIMREYKPSEIRIMNPKNTNSRDHSDHRASAILASQAISNYKKDHDIKVSSYLGYDISDLPTNLSVEQYEQKRQIFMTYAEKDSQICKDPCNSISETYTSYLLRQYKTPQ